MTCSKEKSCGGFRLFIFGALAGLLLGLLFAPKPGRETVDSLRQGREGLLDAVIRRLPV